MKLGKIQFFKTNPATGSLFLLGETDFLASGNHYFRFFKRLFKVEAVFVYSGNVFFNILHPVCANGFSALRKQYLFLVRAIFQLVEPIIRVTRKQCSKKELALASGKLIFWLV